MQNTLNTGKLVQAGAVLIVSTSGALFLARHKLRSNSEQRKRRNPADSQLKTAPSGTPSPYLIVVSLYSRLSL